MLWNGKMIKKWPKLKANSVLRANYKNTNCQIWPVWCNNFYKMTLQSILFMQKWWRKLTKYSKNGHFSLFCEIWPNFWTNLKSPKSWQIWLYNHPRVNVCKTGAENWPNIRKIRRFAKVAKIAIFLYFGKGLMRQEYEKWSSFWVNSKSIKSWQIWLVSCNNYKAIFFCFFFVIETSEQHPAIDLVNFVYYPTGFVWSNRLHQGF